MKNHLINILILLFSIDNMEAQTLMTENDVWNLIDSVKKIENKDVEKMRFLMYETLISKSDTTIASFDAVVQKLFYKAKLWDFVAIDKIFSDNSLMTEDNHFYFQYGLISLGKKAFYNVLQNPDNLLEYIPKDAWESGKSFYFDSLDFVGGCGFRIFTKKYGNDKLYSEILESIQKNTPEFHINDTYQGYKAKNLTELQNRLSNICYSFSSYRNYKKLFLFWFKD